MKCIYKTLLIAVYQIRIQIFLTLPEPSAKIQSHICVIVKIKISFIKKRGIYTPENTKMFRKIKFSPHNVKKKKSFPKPSGT